ncbi:uncharacterized protein LOC120326822 [Styela clava]
MWVKLLTFVAGAVIATVITLWVNSKEEKNQHEHKTGNGYGGLPPLDGSVVKLTDTSDEAFACAICLENAKNTVFQPCGHICSCQTCALKLNDCPICRRRIQQMSRVYLA